MPRRKVKKRLVLSPDPVYNSVLLTRLINRVMKHGKKTVAEKAVYGALDLIKKKLKVDPSTVFEKALENIMPRVEVRSRRVGGAAYQVPMPVRGDRQESLAIRWLVLEARKRQNKQYHTFAEKLAVEITDAYNETGSAYNKKLEIQKIAEANKAFAHLRW